MNETSNRLRVVSHISEVLTLPEKPEFIAVDMPIGLLAIAERGGRPCEVIARDILQKRRNSVFSSPARAALKAESYKDAVAINRDSSEEGIGLSRQSFAIFPKLREIDRFITPELQRRVREVHPELCFYVMNGGKPMAFKKKGQEGESERLKLLEREGFHGIRHHAERFRRSEAGLDDLVDACAACWTAARIARGEAFRVPETPERDETGLLMEMWM